jgi:hypothetical protein
LAAAIVIHESTGLQHELRKEEIETRTLLKQSAMLDDLAANLTPEQLADLIAYPQSLK